jgi:SRSO17 transposase
MLFPMVIRDSAAEAEEQSDRRFLAFIDTLMPVLTHPAQEDSLRAYCTGLCLENGRKSMEPIAANLAPKRTQAAHEALQNFMGAATFRRQESHAKSYFRVSALVLA